MRIRHFILILGIILSTAQLPLQAQSDSIVQIAAEVQGLETVSLEDVPPLGTFWLALPGGTFAPMPSPPIDPSLPMYTIADGFYLVDETDGRLPRGDIETALEVESNAVVNLIVQIQGTEFMRMMRLTTDDLPGVPGGGSGGGSPTNIYPYTIDTNLLWLELVTVTNHAASLVIHPPVGVSNQVYELLYATNLLTPPTNWQWVLRSFPDVTNLVVPNATNNEGFYRLRAPGDLVANDSLGTNFWITFPGIIVNNPHFSLFISSPVGARVTVTTPGLLTNGPTVIVTNSGDANLAGTYLLTNLTSQEQSDWSSSGLDTNSPSYVKGTNWVVADAEQDASFIIAYSSAAGTTATLYQKSGANLNGATNDWESVSDTNSPPKTICTQVPIVNQMFTAIAGSGTNIPLPSLVVLGNSSVSFVDYDVVKTNGIHITADQPVSVYGLDFDIFGSTAFTALPTGMLGTNYCVMARAANNQLGVSELAFVGTTSNTTVTIIPSPTADLVDNSTTDPILITNVQPGETFQIRGLVYTDDVTGTRVTANKPIALFGGASVANVPDENTLAGNPLVQQQMPIESWGNEILAISLAERTNGDTYRVLAAYDDTEIIVSGKIVTVLDENSPFGPWSVTTSNKVIIVTTNAGNFLDVIIDGAAEFDANKPIQIAQFANGVTSDHAYNPLSLPFTGEGDSCEILLPPVGHYLQTNIIFTLTNDAVMGDFDENFANIIVPHSSIGDTAVDGTTIAATNFIAIGNSGYFGAKTRFTNSGPHTVTSTQPVGVEVYGWGVSDAYGYFGGFVK